MAEEPTHTGFAHLSTPGSDYAAWQFMMTQTLARVRTAALVMVESVTTSGGVNPAGYVDVRPLVAQVDGLGKTTPHGIIHNLPYVRIQGGTNAFILDPEKGDIGIAVFCDRDSSSAKETKGHAPPGSRRRFSMADGVYFGGLLNAAPSRYVRVSGSGIVIHAPDAVIIEAPSVTVNASTSATVTAPTTTINGNTVMNGNLSVSGTVTNAGTNIGSTHRHPDPQGGIVGTPV